MHIGDTVLVTNTGGKYEGPFLVKNITGNGIEDETGYTHTWKSIAEVSITEAHFKNGETVKTKQGYEYLRVDDQWYLKTGVTDENMRPALKDGATRSGGIW